MDVQQMFKYRIYPSGKQKIRLLKQFKICKEIYNTLLGLNKTLWTTSKPDFDNLVKDIKTTCPEYYYQAYSQVLQNVSDRLSKAFDNFFSRIKLRKKGIKIKAGYPRFKSIIQSITYPQDNGSAFKFISNTRLDVSKIGNLPIVLHRVPKGKVKTLTIKHNKAGQWFAIFSCELPDVIVKHPSTEKVGIDVGLENFATLSNGEVITNPRHLVKAEHRLKLLHRRLSRKVKGSANRRKARFKLARGHLKVSNIRADWLHKLSRSLTIRYGIISGEHLDIKNMLKNHIFAKHISDASWGMFMNMLSYKEVILGGQFLQNPKTRGSSHRCSKCGFVVEDMPLSRRKFSCPKCFNVLHRDLNASINHLNDTAGLAGIYTPVDIKPLHSHKGNASLVVEAGTICDIC